MDVGGIFKYSSNGEEATGAVTSLASYLSRDGVSWTATTISPSQIGNEQALVSVTLTDTERASFSRVKFESDRTDLDDLIEIFRPEGGLYAGGIGEDPVRCSRSGTYFPASRIKRNRSGKPYGDKFFVEER